MPVPSNITPETATAIATNALPYSATVLAADWELTPDGTLYPSTCDSTQYHALWWAYTTAPTETWLAVAADTPGSSFASPNVSIWSGALGALVQYTIDTQNFCDNLGGGNFWLQVPVTANTRYYFQVTDDNNSTIDADLIVRLIGAPSATVPAGSVVISDDADGFPAIAMTIDGTVSRIFPFPAGEFTDTFPTGEVATQDGEDDLAVAVFDATLSTRLGTYTPGSSKLISAVKSNRVDRVYVASHAGVTAISLQAIDATAAAIGSAWTLPANSSTAGVFAVNQTDTRFYYGTSNASGEAVHAYDLANSMALSDLHSGFPGEYLRGVGDGFCLADGSILFAYASDGLGSDSVVRRFDTSGTVLNTYTLTSGDFVYFNHFCYGDETSFWVWGFTTLGQGVSVIRQIQISDGATLQEFEIVTVGTSGGPTQAADGLAISNSCPIFVLTAALAPPTPPLPVFVTGTPVEVPIRRVRQLPVLNNDGFWLFLKRFEVDALVGQGAVSGQGQTPKIEMQISRDGGQTFGNLHTVSAGRLGQYRQRLRFLALGSGRNLVIRVIVSDPVLWALYGGFLDVEPGIN